MEKINGELELARKKKQVLDKLFNEGKVSQPTYDSFTGEIADAVAEIEAKQRVLVEKMKSKIEELEQQMKTLEFLLVNSEIRHVSGEVEDGTYNHECSILSLGLETTRQELNEIKEAIANLSEPTTDFPQLSPTNTEEQSAQETSESANRIEIIMDTETSTSIETTVEEQAQVEPPADLQPEKTAELEEAKEDTPSTEAGEVSFQQESGIPAETETDTSEAKTEEETPQEQN